MSNIPQWLLYVPSAVFIVKAVWPMRTRGPVDVAALALAILWALTATFLVKR